MRIEVTLLILAALLQMVQMVIPGYFLNKTPQGRAWNASARDAPRPSGGVLEGRAMRAFENHSHNLLLFAVAVLAVVAGNEGTWWTATLAWVYLIARVTYVPAYLLGWTPWRSAIWAASFLAIGLMLLAALF